MPTIRLPMLLAAFLAVSSCFAQQPVATIVTNSSTSTLVTYTNLKGAGLTGSGGTLQSAWDSTGTNFALQFNSGVNNITSITQFTVTGHPRPFITWGVNAVVKVRRLGNSYVNNTGNYFNFWTVANSIPAAGATTGTFDMQGPDITTVEAALLTNNINSGYDNIFQNTIINLHVNNIERVDFILPNGLKPLTQLDIDGAGAVVFDRGAGDPFKIAAILTLDGSGNPLTFGTPVLVNAAQFGPGLLAANVNTCTFTHDPKYGNAPRPSKFQSQNMRGVFMSLGELGIAINQLFYGYVLYDSDVPVLNADWTTYPNNTNSNSQLDPVNVLSIYKDVNSLLASPVIFNVEKQNNGAVLSYKLSDDLIASVAIERSLNGRDFAELVRLPAGRSGNYSYTDNHTLTGTSYYRLKTIAGNGKEEYSEIRSLRTTNDDGIKISPVPARDFLVVSLPSCWQRKKITASLFTTSGARLLNHVFLTTAAEHTISLQGIKPGSYFLQLTNTETGLADIKKFVVIR